VQNPVTPLKSIIIVHPFPSKERKTNMKATSETKPTKRGKGRTRRSLALTAQDWEFVEKTAREQKVSAAEVLRTLVAKGRRAYEADATADRIGQVQADLRALEARLDNLTVTLEMIGKNGASALILLKTIFGKIHPDGDSARRALPPDVGDAYRELSRNAAQIFTNLMEDNKKKLR
jgi:hypothetical protein